MSVVQPELRTIEMARARGSGSEKVERTHVALRGGEVVEVCGEGFSHSPPFGCKILLLRPKKSILFFLNLI